MAETLTISQAEQKVLNFINEERPKDKQLQINQKTQTKAIDAAESVPKEQNLLLVTGKNITTYWGYFEKEANTTIVDAVEEKLKESDFWVYAIHQGYKHVGINIKAFKSGKVFLCVVLHSDKPVYVKKPNQNKAPQQPAQPAPKKNANKAPKKEEEPEIDNNEQTIEYVREKVMKFINQRLVNCGKSELTFSQRAFDCIDQYNIECIKENRQVSREALTPKISGFMKPCVSIINIKDARLIDAKIADTFFVSAHNNNNFKTPMNAIAISFQYSPEGFGSLIMFAGYDKTLPEPEKWNDKTIDAPKAAVHPKIEFTLVDRLKNLSKNRDQVLIQKVNDFRKENELSELKHDEDQLRQVAYAYAKDIGMKQATSIKFKEAYYEGQNIEANALKAFIPVNNTNYVERAFTVMLGGDGENIMKQDWENVAVSFFENRTSHTIVVVLVFAKEKEIQPTAE